MHAPLTAPLDDVLPRFRHREVHRIAVAASRERVAKALRAVTVPEIRMARLLFAIRALPALLVGNRPTLSPTTLPALVAMQRAGFVLLHDGPDGSLVLGVAGRFWDWLHGGAVSRLDGREAFLAFADPACVRAAIGFGIEDAGDGGLALVTETRIEPLGPGASRRFALYWMLIRPGSGLLRRTWLAAVRRRAER